MSYTMPTYRELQDKLSEAWGEEPVQEAPDDAGANYELTPGDKATSRSGMTSGEASSFVLSEILTDVQALYSKIQDNENSKEYQASDPVNNSLLALIEYTSKQLEQDED